MTRVSLVFSVCIAVALLAAGLAFGWHFRPADHGAVGVSDGPGEGFQPESAVALPSSSAAEIARQVMFALEATSTRRVDPELVASNEGAAGPRFRLSGHAPDAPVGHMVSRQRPALQLPGAEPVPVPVRIAQASRPSRDTVDVVDLTGRFGVDSDPVGHQRLFGTPLATRKVLRVIR